MHDFIILFPANEEFVLARRWYKEQGGNNLSNRFAKAVKLCIKKIQSNPYAYAIRYKNVRVMQAEKFPYAVHFYLDENSIVVITSIIFYGRNPSIAESRILED